MGNKSRLRQSFDAQGNPAKSPHWRNVRDMTGVGRAFSLAPRMTADRVQTFRSAKPLNSQAPSLG